MEIYYWNDVARCPRGNFGDKLNLWLWPKIIPEVVRSQDNGLLVGIGTVLSEEIPKDKRVAIFGSGVGYGRIPTSIDNWHIYCLRGPQTAFELKVDPDLAVTDAALLVRTCYSQNRTARVSAKNSVSFMPHWQTPEFPWKQACETLDITYIDPASPIEDILHLITSSHYILAEAMHGAIIADALRVPWVPIATRTSINIFKWLDWCASMQVQYQPINLFWKRLTLNNVTEDSKLSPIALTAAKKCLIRLTQSPKLYLSSDQVLIKNEQKLLNKTEQLREDWQQGVFI